MREPPISSDSVVQRHQPPPNNSASGPDLVPPPPSIAHCSRSGCLREGSGWSDPTQNMATWFRLLPKGCFQKWRSLSRSRLKPCRQKSAQGGRSLLANAFGWASRLCLAKVLQAARHAGGRHRGADRPARRPHPSPRSRQPRRIQPVVATRCLSICARHSSSASAGVFQLRVLRGWAFRVAATAAIAS